MFQQLARTISTLLCAIWEGSSDDEEDVPRRGVKQSSVERVQLRIVESPKDAQSMDGCASAPIKKPITSRPHRGQEHHTNNRISDDKEHAVMLRFTTDVWAELSTRLDVVSGTSSATIYPCAATDALLMKWEMHPETMRSYMTGFSHVTSWDEYRKRWRVICTWSLPTNLHELPVIQQRLHAHIHMQMVTAVLFSRQQRYMYINTT
jgi:hypothetical protein